MEELEGGGFWGDVICNMAMGGIGTIYGAWGGALVAAYGASAIASGGATIVIGLVAGSVLSAVAC